MMRVAAFVLILAAPALAAAEQAESGQPPQRIRSVTLTGAETCPPSTDTEVVVCSRINPDEQFRVPKELRDEGPIPAQRQSWVNRTQTMRDVSRVAGGLPNTCSAVGTGGQTGCAQQLAEQYAAERRARRAAEADVPN